MVRSNQESPSPRPSPPGEGVFLPAGLGCAKVSRRGCYFIDLSCARVPMGYALLLTPKCLDTPWAHGTLVYASSSAIEDVLAVRGQVHEDERFGLVMLSLRALNAVGVATHAHRKQHCAVAH